MFAQQQQENQHQNFEPQQQQHQQRNKHCYDLGCEKGKGAGKGCRSFQKAGGVYRDNNFEKGFNFNGSGAFATVAGAGSCKAAAIFDQNFRDNAGKGGMRTSRNDWMPPPVRNGNEVTSHFIFEAAAEQQKKMLLLNQVQQK